LFSRLAYDAPPALLAFHGRGDQMSVAPARNYRNDASDPDLRALLDRPLHAVELEDGKSQRDPRSVKRLGLGPAPMVWLRVERKLNAIIGDRGDGSAANFFSSCNVKLLPDFGAQNAGKMRRVFAHQSSGVSGNLVSDPAAVGHKSAFSSQLSVKAHMGTLCLD